MRGVADRLRAPRRAFAATVFAVAALTVLPATPVLGHAQLVSSTPGAGEVLEEAPTEIRLIFSEPIEASYSEIDILDPEGSALAIGVGAPDPEDPFTLVAPFDGTVEGTYTINWRVLSAADGHVTSGFVVFGIGDVNVTGAVGGPSAQTGGLHAGHSTTTAIGDVVGRSLTYAGFMPAAGLGVIAWLVVRPVLGRTPRWMPVLEAALLLLAASGSVVLFFVMGAALARETGTAETGDLLASRTGLLVVVRAALALVAALATLALARANGGGAAALASIAGLAGLSIVAAGGHAAGYNAMAPVASDVVHLWSGGVWIAGLLTLAVLIVFQRADATFMRAVIPRFSAIALVAIALVVASGTYASWLAIHAFTPWDSAYGMNLLIKIGVVGVALALGALNYFDGGRNLRSLGGIGRRVLAETALAAGVIVLTANLTTGVPPSGAQPVPLQAAASSVTDASGITLAVQPGRPGPNRLVVEVERPAAGDSTADVVLQRLDTDVGTARVPLRPLEHGATHPEGGSLAFALDGVTLPAESLWDASVVLVGPEGAETARERYTFSFGPDGLSSGRDAFPIGPTMLIAMGLAGAAVLAIGYWFGGGVLPRTDPGASRVALLAGGAIAGVLAAAILLSGPPL